MTVRVYEPCCAVSGKGMVVESVVRAATVTVCVGAVIVSGPVMR